METIEDLKRRIKSTEDLQSVVKTMKALAAVKIRQYERAVEALEAYNQAVQTGLRMIVDNRPGVHLGSRSGRQGRLGGVVFGSDQGMCGPLNDQIAAHAIETMDELEPQKEKQRVLALGQRARMRLEDVGRPVESFFPMPHSVTGITAKVTDILSRIESWNTAQEVTRVVLFYSQPLSGSRYRPANQHLLPLDRRWLQALREQPRPGKTIPLFTMDWDRLFSSLVRQYLFVSIYRAMAESLASENASRLASMQGAEKNIKDRLSELNMQFHQKRQLSITGELLDIVSGFEVLEADD